MHSLIVGLITTITGVFLSKVDKKYRVANKINSKLNINKKWKLFILSAIIYIIGFCLYIMGGRINIFTFIGGGLIFGITLCLSDKIASEFKLANGN